MRLFIAINFDKKTKENILAVQRRLKTYGKGNFTREENLHLTLAFLGEIPEERLPDIKVAMESVTIPKMHLEFSDIGCFRNESELWWIGIKENEALTKLQKDLSIALREKGFSLESRKYKPHITLARQMHAGKIPSKELLPEVFSTEVSVITLMLSHRANGRLTYTELYSVKSEI